MMKNFRCAVCSLLRLPRCVTVVALVLLMMMVGGHTALAQAAAAIPSMAAPTISFDVVSVRLNKSGASAMSLDAGTQSDGVTFTNVPLFRVVLYAYRINRFYQAVGLPDWSMRERYDIAAKVDAKDVEVFQKLSRAQRMTMFQRVLEDRFKLKSHREPREVQAYALVAARGGVKMKEAAPGETYANGAKVGNDTISHGVTMFVTGPGKLKGQGATVSDLAAMLSDYGRDFIGRDVVDKSGLAAKYDFLLQFAPEPIASDGDGPSQPQATPVGPSIFTALQEQLGLKLEPAKTTEEFFVIDGLERPSEN